MTDDPLAPLDPVEELAVDAAMRRLVDEEPEAGLTERELEALLAPPLRRSQRPYPAWIAAGVAAALLFAWILATLQPPPPPTARLAEATPAAAARSVEVRMATNHPDLDVVWILSDDLSFPETR